MRSRTRRTLAAVATTPLLVGALAAPAAAAAPATAPKAAAGSAEVTGGTTRLTIAPGVAGALVQAGIVPLPQAPATATIVQPPGGETIRYAFPITGGTVNLSNVSGSIGHSGGLNFYNLTNRKSLTVQGFRVVLGSAPKLTGYVPALRARIAVFNLNLGTAKITPTSGGVRVDNVGATLTAGAAAGLNGALQTSVFAPGLKVGTASVTAELGS